MNHIHSHSIPKTLFQFTSSTILATCLLTAHAASTTAAVKSIASDTVGQTIGRIQLGGFDLASDSQFAQNPWFSTELLPVEIPQFFYTFTTAGHAQIKTTYNHQKIKQNINRFFLGEGKQWMSKSSHPLDTAMFYESIWGNANPSTPVSANTNMTTHTKWHVHGVGVKAKLTFDTSNYVFTSLNYGHLETRLNHIGLTNNIVNNTHYTQTYWGYGLGIGQHYTLGADSLDLYAMVRQFILKSKHTSLGDDPISFKNMTQTKARLGARYTQVLQPSTVLYYDLTFDNEWDKTFKAQWATTAMPSTTDHGLSAYGQIGIAQKISTDLTLDAHLSVATGHHQGYGATAFIRYQF